MLIDNIYFCSASVSQELGIRIINLISFHLSRGRTWAELNLIDFKSIFIEKVDLFI